QVLSAKGASEAIALGAKFAQELFQPRRALCHQSKADLAAIGETTCVQNTQKLRRDFATLADGGAVYWPNCLCTADDLSLFQRLYQELTSAPGTPLASRRLGSKPPRPTA
ncbi:unnamed protein product, partial [Effrenium voratum]